MSSEDAAFEIGLGVMQEGTQLPVSWEVELRQRRPGSIDDL